MVPPTGNAQLSQANTDYNTLGNEGTQSWNAIFPMLTKLAPMLMQTLSGVNTPLMMAARAPVIGQTQQDIRTGQNQQGGTANPNALWQDVATGGEQQAGLAGDAMLTQALSALQGLITGGMNFSGQSESAAGAGETSVGQAYNQENASFWNNLLSGAGTAASLFTGGMKIPGLGGSGSPGGSPAPNPWQSGTGGIGVDPGNPWTMGTGGIGVGGPSVAPSAMASGVPAAGADTGMSTMISAPPAGSAPSGWQESFYLPGYGNPGG